jgi:hypothetical protein
MREGDDSEFFVGYLATPARTGRFLRRAVVLIALLAGGVALLAGAGQRDPGAGVWDLEHATMLEGDLSIEPAPLVRVKQNGVGKSVLLVSEGKIGARERVSGSDGKRVRVHGHMISGRGLPMLELDEGAGAVEVLGAGGRAAGVAWGEVATLRGELVDPKCFGGAMKPGDGKTHKSCAVLCLRGGIPLVLMAVEEGKTVSYLVVDAKGRSVAGDGLEQVRGFVGDWAEVRGRVGRYGDVRVLEILSDGIRRL